jgi:sRNA-binding regulator protein Hfq
MSNSAPPPGILNRDRIASGRRQPKNTLPQRVQQKSPELRYYRLTSHTLGLDQVQNQAELFYLQKQIQGKTSMVFVLASGEMVRGLIEWYDLHSIKVCGREKSLIYKSSIKYMYKETENGG